MNYAFLEMIALYPTIFYIIISGIFSVTIGVAASCVHEQNLDKKCLVKMCVALGFFYSSMGFIAVVFARSMMYSSRLYVIEDSQRGDFPPLVSVIPLFSMFAFGVLQIVGISIMLMQKILRLKTKGDKNSKNKTCAILVVHIFVQVSLLVVGVLII